MATLREYKKRHCGVICGVFLALELTNRQQFSIVCRTLTNYRNDVKVFKTKVESQATGEWFYCKILNILTLFLWSIRVQTMENFLSICFFTITLTVFDDHSSRPISDREVDRSVIVKFQMVLLITLFGCL